MGLTIDFMKENFTDFVHNVLVVEGDKTKSPVSVGYLIEKKSYD